MTLNLAMIPQFFDFDVDSKIKITRQNNYTFMNYLKPHLEKNNVRGLFRSVILNDKKEVVCYSPPKSMTYEYFMETEMNDSVIGMEFIEGTMINVFWHDGSWEYSTKSVLGCKNRFYNYPNAKTFKVMFDEACEAAGLNIELLDKTKCYSFVLQHPENRIVIPYTKPQLYIIAAYTIKNNIVELHDPFKMHYWVCFENTRVCFPRIFDLKEYDMSHLINTFACPHGNTSPYGSMGIVFYNTQTGNRTKLRNITYEKVRQLRGNQAKLEYQYLCLRQKNKVAEFLTWYPETKHYITDCRNKLHLFTKELFSNYVSCFMKKEKKLSLYSGRYKRHMYNLHQLYTGELKSKNMYITFHVVKEYVNTLAPALLMHSLNYEMSHAETSVETSV